MRKSLAYTSLSNPPPWEVFVVLAAFSFPQLGLIFSNFMPSQYLILLEVWPLYAGIIVAKWWQNKKWEKMQKSVVFNAVVCNRFSSSDPERATSVSKQNVKQHMTLAPTFDIGSMHTHKCKQWITTKWYIWQVATMSLGRQLGTVASAVQCSLWNAGLDLQVEVLMGPLLWGEIGEGRQRRRVSGSSEDFHGRTFEALVQKTRKGQGWWAVHSKQRVMSIVSVFKLIITVTATSTYNRNLINIHWTEEYIKYAAISIHSNKMPNQLDDNGNLLKWRWIKKGFVNAVFLTVILLWLVCFP